jgi:hypothetical protein
MIYTVSAVNDVGEGTSTAQLSVILGTVPDTPGAPVNVGTTMASI